MYKLARQMLNRASSNRTISKQECTVQVGRLDLVRCSEVMETVSISGHYNLSKNSNYAKSTMISKYGRREKTDPVCGHISLHQFFLRKKNNRPGQKVIIPHYVGGQSQPVYPITEGYARSILIIHKPWHESDKKQQSTARAETCIPEFEAFLTSANCPSEVLIPFERVKNRFLEKTTHRESVGEAITIRDVPRTDRDTQDLLAIVGTFQAGAKSPDDYSGYQYNRGEDFDWGKRRFPVRATCSCYCCHR